MSLFRLRSILEASRKDLLKATDPSFIHHKQHTSELPVKNRSGTRYIDTIPVTTRTHGLYAYMIVYKTRSSKLIDTYEQRILSTELPRLIKKGPKGLQTMSVKDAVMYVINKGDLKVKCTCPAFTYWGYAWLLTNRLKAIEPDSAEKRPPNIRNPQRRGSICKHLDLVLTVLPLSASKIVADVEYYEKEED